MFILYRHLGQHYDVYHGNPKVWPCNTCIEVFYTRDHLYQHRKRIHCNLPVNDRHRLDQYVHYDDIDDTNNNGTGNEIDYEEQQPMIQNRRKRVHTARLGIEEEENNVLNDDEDEVENCSKESSPVKERKCSNRAKVSNNTRNYTCLVFNYLFIYPYVIIQ